MEFEALPSNLARVRCEISDIQAREGLSGDVKIIAVTKGHSAAAVLAAHDAGVTDVGENRVQEALGKQDVTQGLRLNWHLIGHLQSNKARLVLGRFQLVHSVDSVRLADALQRAADKAGASQEAMDVLLQVNVAQEPQKSGCSPDQVGDIAGHVGSCSKLRLVGLMTMAPFTEDEAVQRRVFASLRRLRDDLRSNGVAVNELSMGMSGDFKAAVAEGATILRLGTVLFGERPV